jgi:hypothetical protein
VEEVEQLVERRLRYLFDRQGARIRDEEPLYPFEPEQLAARANQRTRDILDWCRQHHEACVQARRIVVLDAATTSSVAVQTLPPPSPLLSQLWNDHKNDAPAPPEDADALLSLLSWGLETLADELGAPKAVTARMEEGFLLTEVRGQKLAIGLCNKDSKGGGLGKQVDALTTYAQGRSFVPVALRCSEYPPPGKTKIAQQLKAMMLQGGRRVTAHDSEWRQLTALRTFCERYRHEEAFTGWLRQERPLYGITSLRAVLALEEPVLTQPEPEPAPQPQVTEAPAPKATPGSAVPQTSVAVTAGSVFSVGNTRGLNPQPVTVEPSTFTTHAAFLGSTKSGKTTLALNIIEQLIEQRVPVLMIDRKGDLCRYAQPDFWSSPALDDASGERKRKLQGLVDVQVFTPGEPRGRALGLPVVPKLAELAAHDRAVVARYAASALGTMMNYRGSKTDETRLGILGKAIELVGQAKTEAPLGVRELVQVLDQEDPELVAAVGKLDPKHFRALVENLETLRLRYEPLLAADGEPLSPELLFGIGNHAAPGRARLSIISTKFLSDNAAVDFWVARLLSELSRWANRRPSDALQAVLFIDEADIYLPATSKPATKEPLLDLLKRARSAGLGIFLATQSPGDLDYRCRDNIRTWFVGRVAEKVAVDKMKPLLAECRTRVDSKLGQAKIGEFFKLQDGEVLEFKATQSLMQTKQVPQEEIASLARRHEPGDGHALA